MRRRFLICLLLTAAVLALPSAAWAEEETVWECREWAWDEYAVTLADASDVRWKDGFTCYGDQLTGDARTVYKALEAAFAADTVELCKEDGTPAVWQVSDVLTATVSDDEVQAWWNRVYPSIQRACVAFTFDHPEYFWIRTNYGGSCLSSSINGVATVSASASYGVQPTCDTVEKRAEQQSELEAAVQPILTATEGMPTVARVAYFENWLAENNVYNSTAAITENYIESNDTPWSAIGALVEDYSPVCEGYAKAFQLLCHRIGVPCVTVSGSANGGGHMWTAVQLDGTWYFCDPTFDDPTTGSGSANYYSTREYFLTAEQSSHTASMLLTPPTLSDTGYFTGWAVSDGSITGGEQFSGSDATVGIALYDSAGRMLQYGTCTAIQWGSGRMYVAPELDAALVKSAGRITRFCLYESTGVPRTAAKELPAS